MPVSMNISELAQIAQVDAKLTTQLRLALNSLTLSPFPPSAGTTDKRYHSSHTKREIALDGFPGSALPVKECSSFICLYLAF